MREAFGAALQPQAFASRPAPIAVPHAEKLPSDEGTAPADAAPQAAPTTSSPARDPYAEQQRLARSPNSGDIRGVEYELFRTRVYRVRWQLSERFERPVMTSLVEHLTAELGKAYYDQLIEAKFGSGRSTLRRAAWRRGPKVLELRQLNPAVGGPMFLTLSDQASIKSIVAAGGTAAPEPDSIGPWWSEPLKFQQPLGARERDTLVAAFDAVLAGIDWEG